MKNRHPEPAQKLSSELNSGRPEQRAGVPKNELQDHERNFCGELKNRALQTCHGTEALR
jgi:hypothetical protein